MRSPGGTALELLSRSILIACVCSLLLACATAKTPAPPTNLMTKGTVVVHPEVEPGLGSEHGGRVAGAQALLATGDTNGAFAEAGAVADAFRALMTDRAATYVCVANRAELERFSSEHPDAKVVWLDWSFREAIHIQAYIQAGAGHSDEAFALLDEETLRAPYSADPYTERGFLLAKLGRPREALASYQEALRLSRTFPSAASDQAAALRGIGSSLIDLGDLDGADRTFRESLEVEPDNALAQNELLYIANLRAKQKH